MSTRAPRLLPSPLLPWLRAACLPFVTRVFRGQGWRRMSVLSVLLALGTGLVGTWLALDPGPLAREVRVGLRVEARLSLQEFATHTVFFRDGERAPPNDRVQAHMQYVREAARTALATGMCGHMPNLDEVDAARRLATLTPVDGACTPAQRRLAERFLATDGVPTIAPYTSPLGLRGVATLIGTVAAGVLAVLCLLAAPLWAGTVLAQEVHEGTLQPLTGSALTAGQLALGMLAGPMAAIGVLAAPQALLFGSIALATGSGITVFAALASLLVVSLLLATIGQINALVLGPRHSAGVVATLLLTGLGTTLLAAVGFGGELGRGSVGIVAILPPAGTIHCLRQALVPTDSLSTAALARLDTTLACATAGFVVLLVLGGLLVTRFIARELDGLLRRGEALLGALTVSTLSLLALWDGPRRLSELLVASAVLVAIPWLCLLMARAHRGSAARSLRRASVGGLLVELFVVLGAHAILCTVVARNPDLDRVLVAGSWHVLWGVGVTGLVAIRVAAAPSTLALRVGLVVVAMVVLVDVGTALAASGSRGGTWLPWAEASAVLGLLELGCLVGLPWAVLREMRRRGLQLKPSPRPASK